MGRILLYLASALLVATALIHASGQAMVDGWVEGLDQREAAAVCLVWLTDSLSWIVVAALWGVTGRTLERQWLAASAIAAAIPALTALALLTIDPSFFGGWMLLGSVALAGTGLVLGWRR